MTLNEVPTLALWIIAGMHESAHESDQREHVAYKHREWDTSHEEIIAELKRRGTIK